MPNRNYFDNGYIIHEIESGALKGNSQNCIHDKNRPDVRIIRIAENYRPSTIIMKLRILMEGI
jgi:hypothetical protein